VHVSPGRQGAWLKLTTIRRSHTATEAAMVVEAATVEETAKEAAATVEETEKEAAATVEETEKEAAATVEETAKEAAARVEEA
jgi:hypothetical protein